MNSVLSSSLLLVWCGFVPNGTSQGELRNAALCWEWSWVVAEPASCVCGQGSWIADTSRVVTTVLRAQKQCSLQRILHEVKIKTSPKVNVASLRHIYISSCPKQVIFCVYCQTVPRDLDGKTIVLLVLRWRSWNTQSSRWFMYLLTYNPCLYQQISRSGISESLCKKKVTAYWEQGWLHWSRTNPSWCYGESSLLQYERSHGKFEVCVVCRRHGRARWLSDVMFWVQCFV
jgi:hypothetical protein